jgi:protein SCO1/2
MNRRAMTYLFRRIAPLALALAAGLPLAACQQPSAEAPPLEGASIGGPFTLIDKNRKPVTWDQFKGRWRIVYFGYTFCPDVCPVDMQQTMRGLAKFAKEHPALAAKVQPIFITVDPQRDTPEIIGEWTAAFGPNLLGLTGTPEQIDKAAKAFAIYYKKGDETPGGYLMDHLRITYLFGPDGKPVAMLPADKGGDAVAAELAKWVK